MAPTNQQRLMSAYDIKEGKMIMSYFKPKVQQPKLAVDYLRTNFEVMAKVILWIRLSFINKLEK